ncbi:MAG: hypothetical protein RR816_14075, partial [Clostridia bacterium]
MRTYGSFIAAFFGTIGGFGIWRNCAGYFHWFMQMYLSTVAKCNTIEPRSGKIGKKHSCGGAAIVAR